MRNLTLGPFHLQRVLGSGGMGTVWLGVHRELSRRVAVKTLHRDPGGRGSARAERFASEVRAVARLDHPHVVQMFDHGRVAEADAADGLLPGSPWLAMEVLDGGPVRGPLPWPAARAFLEALLDGLAHAHAHGLVHRDIKPSNLLLDGGGALRITDFGIAHSLGSGSDSEAVAGTLAYMAPEQLAGDWRDLGPWTDLYAVGGVAWAWVTGRPPFADAGAAIVDAKLTWPLPELQPAHAVPEGLRTWLARLLARSPRQRFRRAADARCALDQLGAVLPAAHRPSASAEPPSQTRTLADAPRAQQQQHDVLEPAPVVLPELPEHWPSEAQARPAGLRGGLGLFGLRQPRLVGRAVERRALWSALRDARHSPRAVILQGPAGVGKSRLAEALCVTAHAQGAARVLRAVHGPTGGPDQGLGPMLARHLGCGHLDPPEVALRLTQRADSADLEDVDRAALTAWIAPRAGQERKVAHLVPALIRLIRARQRPAMLWLDDVQWGLDAVLVADALLEAEGLPVLVLLTARSEDLEPGGPVRAALDTIQGRRRCRVLEVSPLEPQHQHALIQELLELTPSLVARLAARTEGNPLFAVQLAADWVERATLRESNEGLLLDGGADLELPAGLAQLWQARITRVLGARPRGARTALHAAAALGLVVEQADWERVCTRLSVSPDPSLVTRLRRAELIRDPPPGTDGWAWIHGMLRAALEQEAADPVAVHRACAEVLADRPDATHRVALHWLAAQEPQRALPLLEEVVEESSWRHDPAVAAMWRDRWARALDSAAVPRGHLLRIRLRLAELEAKRRVLPPSEVEEELRALADAPAGDLDARVTAVLMLGVSLAHAGRTQEGLEAAERAYHLTGGGPPLLRGRAAQNLANHCARTGRPGSAYAREALAVFQEHGHARGVMSAHQALGHAATVEGDLPRARRHLEASVALAEREGHVQWRDVVLGDLSDVLRRMGALEACLEVATRAAARLSPSPYAGVPLLNRALALVLLGRYAEADRAHAEVVELHARHGWRRMRIVEVALELAVSAAQAEWSRYDAVVDEAERCMSAAEDAAELVELVLAQLPDGARRARVAGWRDDAVHAAG